MKLYTKFAWITLFLFTFQICSPVIVYATETTQSTTEETAKSGGFGKWLLQFPQRVIRNFSVKNQENLNPDELQNVVDESKAKTFEGNPVLKEEQSTILRPIKQIALKVLDGQIGIVRSFLSFQTLNTMKKGLDTPAIQNAMNQAKQVVGSMSSSQLSGVNKALSKMGISQSLSKGLAKAGPGMQTFMKQETNFALMSVISTLIAMGIYDGLDVSSMKDKVILLDPLNSQETVDHGFTSGLASSMISRNFNSFFNNQFDKVFEKMLNSKGFGGKILQSLSNNVDEFGKKLFKATRMGISNTQSGPGLAEKLGLVGVGGGAQLTLKGLLKSVSTGLAYGLGAQLVIDTVSVGIKGNSNASVIAGDRNSLGTKIAYNSYRFQRTGNKVKDWVNERKFALLRLFDGYKKEPITKIVGTVSGFAGGYVGSVIAGALLVGGGLPAMIGGVMISSVFGGIGSFLGSWAARKFERGEGMKDFRRGLVESRLFKAIKKMLVFTSGQITESEAKQLATDRSKDMYKLESMGQTYSRMFLVEDFPYVELYQDGEYVNMRIDEERGEPFDMEAHIRYQLINLKGDQGTWDDVTNQIYNLGNVQKNTGFDVHYITDDDSIFVDATGILAGDRADSGFRVSSNGIIQTKDPEDASKWIIRGLNVNTDIFLRTAKRRFTWNWDLNAFQDVNADKLDRGSAGMEPFMVVLENEPEDNWKNALEKMLLAVSHRARDKSVETIEGISEAEESEFFMKLEENGAPHDVVTSFMSMERSEWKNMLIGKIQRGYEDVLGGALKTLFDKDRAQLQESLAIELEKPETATVWDTIQQLINPTGIAVQFTL